jgi:hypothetical protein
VRWRALAPAAWRWGSAALAAWLVGGAPCAASAQPPAHPFAPGEVALYSVEFSGVGIGSGSIRVDADSLGGAPAWRLRFAVRGGIPFFRINDIMESWFDPATGMSRRFTQDLHEGPKHYLRQFDFNPERRTFTERGKPEAPGVAEPLDDASFLFFVRLQPLEVGRTYEWARYFRPETNPIKVTVLRKERVRVPAGTFDAIVVQPAFKSKGIFAEGGQAQLWLADDPTRRVLQLRSKLSFGSLNLYLTSYTPGAR